MEKMFGWFSFVATNIYCIFAEDKLKKRETFMTKDNNNPVNEGKLKALQAAMSKIEKDFGKGSIMRMGDEQIENVEVIPTGSIGLNAALGVGGYPRGRIIEIY